MKTILIVDDDLAVLEVLKLILEGDGYTHRIATTREGAFKILQTDTIDVILMDIWLHGEDGCAITKEIKKSSQYRNIPIILVSAVNELEKRKQESGADDYLAKPFDIIDLSKMLEKYTKK